MGKALSDETEMFLIYGAAKDIDEGKYSVEYALDSLKNVISGSEASLKMYFIIYSCMRTGKCYKMGTSKAFTKFLLVHIYKDFGKDALVTAIKAAKGNSEYRQSVNNAQPGILQACHEAIKECYPELDINSIPAADFSSSLDNGSNGNAGTTMFLELPEYHFQSNIDLENISTSSLQSNPDVSKDVFELNIQPAASILNVFSRLSYKAWYAIAEFVDNSTQSYISHYDALNALDGFDKLKVIVKYDLEKNTLTIRDNAFGMEIERFRDAILLDSRNASQSGRNEFGMGLKTAASWFGNVWHVTSTQYGSPYQYTATVDIPQLKELNLNSVKIHRDIVPTNYHGTTVLIEQVTKKITGSRTIGKIRDLLSSMYRRDINNRNIEIWFNDEPIVFEEYPILRNFRGKTWKKELNFDVQFSGKMYNVTGFVAIMNPGSFPKAGFALFRQDRVVVGGTDSNYKPSQIFGQAQSQRSLKLFGELNMNDFPVNQAKDGFIWDDGLEDAFVDTLKDNIQEYIDIADMSIKERAHETQYSSEKSDELRQDVAEVISKAFSNENKSENNSLMENSEPSDYNQTSSELQEYIDTVLNEDVEESMVGNIRTYQIQISPIVCIKFSVQWAIGKKSYWIEYSEITTDNYEVVINIDHPFFMPFSKEEGFKKVLEKFTLAFILAERQAKFISKKEGYIPVNVIKNYMNGFLQKLSEE